MSNDHHVVIVGGGFGGLYLAQSLRNAPVSVTLIDRRNFHLFQPLLYQVATGGLSPANIAEPLRSILTRQKNAQVLLGEVIGFDPQNRRVILNRGEQSYDTLVVATGSDNHYFGHDEWLPYAPGLKTVEDALDIRNRIMMAFECAESEPDPDIRKQLLTFIVIGGGATGIELAGALAEIANYTLRHDFRLINPADSRIMLLEGADRVLPTWPPQLSARAQRSLERLGVTVTTGAMVTEIRPDRVLFRSGNDIENIPCRTVLWAAGIKASPLGEALQGSTGVDLDRSGRVIVEPDCTIRGFPDIFVIGDLAHFKGPDGNPLPGVAPVAMQQGRYVAGLIRARLQAKPFPHFRYKDYGTMATIGRNAAVTNICGFRFSGWFAWMVWLFVHLMYIIEFGNKLLILLQWTWNYFARNRSARLITNLEPDQLCLYEDDSRGRQQATDDPDGRKP